MSLLGPLTCQRAYCGRCGHGVLPWDRAVGLTARSFTPAAERLVCLAGTLSDGFAEAAQKVLPEMAGLRVAETTVQRSTEAVGQRLAEHWRAGRTLGFPKPWASQRDAHGRTCAHVSLDLTGVRQQAKGGGPADPPRSGGLLAASRRMKSTPAAPRRIAAQPLVARRSAADRGAAAWLT